MNCPEHGPYPYEDGCGGCETQALAEAAVFIFGMRGRWLVVYEDGYAIRRRSKQEARREVRACCRIGIKARIRRYRRGLVTRDYELPGLKMIRRAA